MLYLGLLVGLLLQATYLLSQSLFRIDEGTSGLLTSFGAIEHVPASTGSGRGRRSIASRAESKT